jgi:hypothetical protein
VAKWLTRWSAKPVFAGSIPARCSNLLLPAIGLAEPSARNIWKPSDKSGFRIVLQRWHSTEHSANRYSLPCALSRQSSVLRQDRKPRTREGTMTQSTHDRAAELHNLAAHAHAAAAVAHHKADHLTAHELSKQAHEFSMNAHKHAEQNFTISADFKKP